MSARFTIDIFDRREGRIRTDPVAAPGFIDWAANARTGRWAEGLIFGRPAVSRIYGWMQKRSWSRRKIVPFIDHFGIAAEDLAKAPGRYKSFYEFFIRDFAPGRRPFNPDPAVCASPVEGRVLAYPSVSPDQTFPVKRAVFNLREFLRDDRLAGRYAGGTLLISRLGMGDYHYVHFPFSGIPRPASAIPGTYHFSGPYYRYRLVPFYKENHRMITLVETEGFGPAVMVEIGAFAVGSIRQFFRPGIPAAKGDKKARFDLGGSTVALLFERGRLTVDPDILAHTSVGLETYIRLGDSLGRIPGRTDETRRPE